MINLIVLYCQDIEKTKGLYELFDLGFISEKHGEGPQHYSNEIKGFVLELYPLGKRPPSQIRLGVTVNSLEKTKKSIISAFPQLELKELDYGFGERLILKDFDGNTLEISQG